MHPKAMRTCPSGYIEHPVDSDQFCIGCCAANDQELCDALPGCRPMLRLDGKHVIFMKDEVKQ